MRDTGPLRRWLLVLTCVLPAVLQSAAQDSAAACQVPAPDSPSSQGSIADAARQSKAQTKHAKKVITDDELDTTGGVLPRLKLQGPENGSEVVAALAKYKTSHSAEQTEALLRAWYDRYEQMYEAAIQQNENMQAIQSANMSNDNELCQAGQDNDNYQQCQKRRIAEQRGARTDQVVAAKNYAIQNRIQQAFLTIRSGLFQSGLRYEWFKIRNQSGNEL